MAVYPDLISVRQSTIVQQANHAGWSLLEIGENQLASGYVEITNAISEDKLHV